MVVAGRCQVTSIRPIAAGTLDWMTALDPGTFFLWKTKRFTRSVPKFGRDFSS